VVATPIARGEAPDRAGPLLVDWLRGSGYACPDPLFAEDGGAVGAVLRELLHAGESADASADIPDVVVTSGGTGLNRLDRTPEETAALLDVRAPGVTHCGRGGSRAHRLLS
jgi:molybdopterin synthase catalytic subunit